MLSDSREHLSSLPCFNRMGAFLERSVRVNTAYLLSESFAASSVTFLILPF